MALTAVDKPNGLSRLNTTQLREMLEKGGLFRTPSNVIHELARHAIAREIEDRAVEAAQVGGRARIHSPGIGKNYLQIPGIQEIQLT